MQDSLCRVQGQNWHFQTQNGTILPNCVQKYKVCSYNHLICVSGSSKVCNISLTDRDGNNRKITNCVMQACCDAFDSSACSDWYNITVAVGGSAVLWQQVPPSTLNIYGAQSQGLLFEFDNRSVRKKCPKCIYENQTATLQDIQLHNAGIYYAKNDSDHITCINLNVIKIGQTIDSTDMSPTQSTILTTPQDSSPNQLPVISTRSHVFIAASLFPLGILVCCVLVLLRVGSRDKHTKKPCASTV
ncbi:uncharacterized protein LOC108698217 isoform X3 [Xenopus laevis]|nr:uncharacterized protein LOC108698217 isoform X3 [Xenopus laevis]